MPHPKGAGPQHFPILGFLYMYAYILCCRTTNFDVVTHMGSGMYLAVSHAFYPQRPEFQASITLGVSYVYAYID